MNTVINSPVFITVAPNGARHTKVDHPNLPISPLELAHTAVKCAEAGASMIHLHVRDDHGRHSIAPVHYRPAIKAVKDAVGDAMLIQVTSESAGFYNADEQIRYISELEPEGVSLAIRELFIDGSFIDVESTARFLANLNKAGTLIQYILYSPDDVKRYKKLLMDGVIPSSNQNVLFVLGRYSEENSTKENLTDYIRELDNLTPWMVCAFGPNAIDILLHAASLGGHIRVGFENGWLLPDGNQANDNACLVLKIASQLKEKNTRPTSVSESIKLFQQLN